jgi:hypothetical protein
MSRSPDVQWSTDATIPAVPIVNGRKTGTVIKQSGEIGSCQPAPPIQKANSMLIGINPLVTPDLFHCLLSMGHSDELAV